uniref:Uncharacterized protein n=1 Tax=viral metagenome TaxID=1070528 RepID=A0A6C0C0U2_9ZZZZ
MPHSSSRGSCSVGFPDPRRLASMQDECVSKWMVRMTEPESCVSHFAGVASPGCSAAELEGACRETARRFTKRDAEKLCRNIQAAHQDFWPGFWRGEWNHDDFSCRHRRGDNDDGLGASLCRYQQGNNEDWIAASRRHRRRDDDDWIDALRRLHRGEDDEGWFAASQKSVPALL